MKPFTALRPYFIADRWYIGIGLLSLLLVDLLQLVIPRVIKQVIDSLTLGASTEAELLRFGAVMVLLGLLIALFRFCWRYCIIGTSRRIERNLRSRLFSHVIRLPLKSLTAIKTGDLMARMTNDLEAVRMCTGIGVVALIDTVFLGTATVAFMLYISPLLTGITLAPMLLIIIATWRMSRLLHQRFSKVQAAFSTMTEKVRETIAGIAVVKAYVNEKIRLAQFSDTSTDYIHQSLRLVRIWGLLFPMIIFFANISIALLVAAGGRLTILNTITTGDFVAFASYLWIIIWPMMALGWIVNLYQRGAASMVRINDILDIEAEQCAVQDRLEMPRLTGQITIRNLTFAYGYGSPPVLNRMSMSIRPGDTIGITGMTASGKTTLCNLLLRLYEPPPATIFIDGIDVCTLPRGLLRQSIAYVPQDSFLFSDSISGNIAFGRPDAVRPDIQHQAKVAQLIDEVMEFKDGFETIIGERGITLSGGQKQRLCIARALMLPAPILLLDDALASLDLATSRTITEALRDQEGRRTTIIVSNRIDSIRHADMIYVFADGAIAESGSHHKLIQEGGLYYNLYRKQQLEQGAP